MIALPDDELIGRFVGTFCKLDGNCCGTHQQPPPDELNAGIDPEDWNQILWRPKRILTEPDQLTAFYERLPAQLPLLYERLIATWRWLEVSLFRVRLFANPPGEGLTGLSANIFNDPVFEQYLIRKGYIPFAFDTGVNSDLHSYDPVCFDVNHCRDDGDCPIRIFEHEAMLSYGRIGVSHTAWASFRDLIHDTIEAGDRVSSNANMLDG